MRTPRRVSLSQRLHVEVLEDRLQPDAGLLANLATSDYRPDHLLVQFKPDAVPQALPGTTLTSSLSLVPGLYEVEVNDGYSLSDALDAYSSSSLVQAVQPDYIFQADAVPNDSLYRNQWAYVSSTASINGPAAWDIHTGSGRTIVAVIDTGVDYNHPDLAGNMWRNTNEIEGNGIDDDGNGFVDDIYGYNFVSNNGNPMDGHGHGTHVAGIIGATGNNGTGVTGVNWNVQIMALRFLDNSGRGSTSNALRALNYAVQMGATISNNSWTSSVYDSMLETGIRNAGYAGHIYVAAAGNNGKNIDTSKVYPASYNLDNVVVVAGLDSTNRLANWSNFGTTVDIAAPGASIYSTLPGNRYGYLSGTSMATPFVTGALALVRDLNPNWSASQVIQQVVSTADKLSTITKIPGGRLNLGQALTPTTPPDPGPPPPVDTQGARVTGIAAITGNNRLNGIRVSFSDPIVASSFDLADVVQLTGPGGSIVPTGIQAVNGSTTQFDVLFAPQSQTGSYAITLGTGILDQAGNALNQNNNDSNGEVPGDYYAGSVNYTATNQYSGENMPGSIVDYTRNQYPLSVPDASLIGSMQVQINVSHGWMSDMVIKLRSPQGTEILLANRRGGGGKGYNNTIFDSSATKSILQGTGLFAGTFRPEQSLAAFQGQSTQGTWYLIIEDKVRGDSGTLHNWSITFTGSAGSSSLSPAGNRGATDLVQGLLQKVRKVALQPTAQVKPTQNQGSIAIVQEPSRQVNETPVVKSKLQRQQQQLLRAWQTELQLLKRQL